MRSFLTLIVFFTFVTQAQAQLNCNSINTSISTSVSSSTVTLTNNSTPVATNNIYTTYLIDWGDNNYETVHNNSSRQHTYALPGPHRIKIYSTVHDSINSIRCYGQDSAVATTSLNCDSIKTSFITWRTSNHNLRLHNSSTPTSQQGLSTQYKIDWGDGNITNTTSNAQQNHTYTSTGIYTVKLVATIYDSVNNITCIDSVSAIDTIPANNPLFLCHSGYVYAAMGATYSANNVTLVNYSQPGSGSGVTATYDIDWGDGSSTTTNSKNGPTHTYAPGSYTIRLIATHSNTTNTCRDTVYQYVQIQVDKLHGYIYADSVTTNDQFKVWLIKYNPSTNILSAVDSQVVNRSFGYIYYSFSNTPHGSYRVKAHHINGLSSGTGNVPTYHSSSLLWSNASVINHNNIPTLYNIHMKKGTITSGPGFIGGSVLQGANKGTANGIANINVFLLDNNGKVIQHSVTDGQGKYSFSNIDLGNYSIVPENLGYATTPASVTISSTVTSIKNIVFERSKKHKTITPKPNSIIEHQISKEQFEVYPNPARETLNILSSSHTADNIHITMTDITGKMVYQNVSNTDHLITIDTKELVKGVYILSINSESSHLTKKVIIQ